MVAPIFSISGFPLVSLTEVNPVLHPLGEDYNYSCLRSAYLLRDSKNPRVKKKSSSHASWVFILFLQLYCFLLLLIFGEMKSSPAPRQSSVHLNIFSMLCLLSSFLLYFSISGILDDFPEPVHFPTFFYRWDSSKLQFSWALSEYDWIRFNKLTQQVLNGTCCAEDSGLGCEHHWCLP